MTDSLRNSVAGCIKCSMNDALLATWSIAQLFQPGTDPYSRAEIILSDETVHVQTLNLQNITDEVQTLNLRFSIKFEVQTLNLRFRH